MALFRRRGSSEPLTLAAVPVAVAGHVHTWDRVPGSVGFFACATCEEQGVCPGCLNSLDAAFNARAAGLSVVWCWSHEGSSSSEGEGNGAF